MPTTASATKAAELRRREQTLENAVGVLADPEQAIARREARRTQGVREPVHAIVHLAVRVSVVAAHERRLHRIAAPMLAQQVAHRLAVEGVHGAIVGQKT